MKLLFTLITSLCLTVGLFAKPEKGGKGDRPVRPSREEVMKKFDKDGDGKLSDDEKAEIRNAMANRKPPAHILEKFDKNGDGKLCDEEKAEIRKQMITKFDKDGDGKLNPEERKAAMAERAKIFAGKGGEGKEKKGKGKSEKREGKGKGKKKKDS